MKKLTLFAALFTMLLGSAAAAFQNPDDEALQQRQKDWSAAWGQHDAKKLASFFSADADVINPFGRRARGAAEIEQLFADEHAGPMAKSSYEGTIENIRYVGKDVAIVDVDAEVTGMVGDDGATAPPLKHHVTWVAVKQNNTWTALAARAFVTPSRPDARPK